MTKEGYTIVIHAKEINVYDLFIFDYLHDKKKVFIFEDTNENCYTVFDILSALSIYPVNIGNVHR